MDSSLLEYDSGKLSLVSETCCCEMGVECHLERYGVVESAMKGDSDQLSPLWMEMYRQLGTEFELEWQEVAAAAESAEDKAVFRVRGEKRVRGSIPDARSKTALESSVKWNSNQLSPLWMEMYRQLGTEFELEWQEAAAAAESAEDKAVYRVRGEKRVRGSIPDARSKTALESSVKWDSNQLSPLWMEMYRQLGTEFEIEWQEVAAVPKFGPAEDRAKFRVHGEKRVRGRIPDARLKTALDLKMDKKRRKDELAEAKRAEIERKRKVVAEAKARRDEIAKQRKRQAEAKARQVEITRKEKLVEEERRRAVAKAEEARKVELVKMRKEGVELKATWVRALRKRKVVEETKGTLVNSAKKAKIMNYWTPEPEFEEWKIQYLLNNIPIPNQPATILSKFYRRQMNVKGSHVRKILIPSEE